MKKIVNIAAYKFVALPELRSLRARLLALSLAMGNSRARFS